MKTPLEITIADADGIVLFDAETDSDIDAFLGMLDVFGMPKEVIEFIEYANEDSMRPRCQATDGDHEKCAPRSMCRQ